MSVQTVAKRVVDQCTQGKNFDVMHTMYAPDIVSVEPTGKETLGKTPVIQKSERWAAANTIHSQKVSGPYFNGPNQFATHTTWEVTRKAANQRTALEEVAVYTVKDDLITREQFFYGGENW
jgi:hypothetical protein